MYMNMNMDLVMDMDMDMDTDLVIDTGIKICLRTSYF